MVFISQQKIFFLLRDGVRETITAPPPHNGETTTAPRTSSAWCGGCDTTHACCDADHETSASGSACERRAL